MRELTPEERRQISRFMANRRRQMKAHEPRRYPTAILDVKTYIEDFNQLNRSPYRDRVTMEVFTCAAQ